MDDLCLDFHFEFKKKKPLKVKATLTNPYDFNIWFDKFGTPWGACNYHWEVVNEDIESAYFRKKKKVKRKDPATTLSAWMLLKSKKSVKKSFSLPMVLPSPTGQKTYDVEFKKSSIAVIRSKEMNNGRLREIGTFGLNVTKKF